MPDRALFQAMIFNSDGSTTPGVQFSWGSFNGATATITNAGSGDWTLVKNGTGNYTINNPKWAHQIVPMVSCQNNAAGNVASINSTSAGTFGIVTFRCTTGAAQDTTVYFFAYYT